MNHIRLLIRNQCGSHIIHGMPNPLAFQQNYSRYDGPSESGIFFFLRRTRPNVLSPNLWSFLVHFSPFFCARHPTHLRKAHRRELATWCTTYCCKVWSLSNQTISTVDHGIQARSQTFLWGGSNRSNFGTFYDYGWIILQSRWIWSFWGGSDDPPDPPLATGLDYLPLFWG